MSATTPHIIREAIEKVIANLTPSTKQPPLSSRKFVRKSKSGPWEEVPDSDLDRRFTVMQSSLGTTLSFGGLSEHEARASMVVTIGHTKPADLIAGHDRLSADCRTIMLALEDAANYPSDVWSIIHDGDPRTRDLAEQNAWLTDINFVVTYSEAN